MAGPARYTAVLDANVLYPSLTRHVLLSLAEAGLFAAKWTPHITQEWTRRLVADKPDMASKAPRIAQLMEESIPDCLVEGYEPLIDALELPDADDRHVLAAAIAGHADCIVTLNLRDFPAPALAPHGVEAQHPDTFVLNQLELDPPVALATIRRIREEMRHPPRSPPELVAQLERCGLTSSALWLRQHADLI